MRREKSRLFLASALAVVSCCLFLSVLSFPSTTRRALRFQATEPPLEEFPSLNDSTEMARLSGLVYRFKRYDDCNATDISGQPLLPADLQCHFYHHDRIQGTQVMILSSYDYIAVVFAGTDDLRTALADGNLLEKPFGPLDENGESLWMPGPARVHAGFDNNVFMHGLFDTVLAIVTDLTEQYPSHRLFTTGHSLGAANSVLTAVALSRAFPKITCINFGCPAAGNWYWREAVHSIPNLAIWRFCHGWDVVPRLPEYPFQHVGHTLQMNSDEMRAYYQHLGNATLGYASVPLGWSAKPFIFLPGALWSHHIGKYKEYLTVYSAVDPARYYVTDFETTNTTTSDDDDGMADDAYVDPPDDEFIFTLEEQVVW